MLIDWFTVAAQIVNFLVLVALMKYFLYGPLIQAIDAREKRIAGRLAEADRKDQQAELKTEQVRSQIAALESQRAETIAEARVEADQQKSQLVQNARDAVRALQARWEEDLRLEKAAFLQEIRGAASAEILSITRRVLADLAGGDLECATVQVFLERLRSLDAGAIKKLSASEVTVASPTELSAHLQRQIRETIEQRAGSPVQLRFERAAEMAWGIELRGYGQRICWTPDGYLDSLDERLRSALDQRTELGSPLAVE